MLTVVATTASVDEVAQLREQVAQLETKLDRRARRQARGRSLGLSLLLVLGCLLVALSLIALYVRAEVVNTDRYVDTMAPIAESPAVQQAVGDKLQAAIDSRVDFTALLQDALPPRADPLAPALANTLQQAIRRGSTRSWPPTSSSGCGPRRTGERTRASWRCSPPASRAGCGSRATPSTSTSAPRSTACGPPWRGAGWSGSPPRSRRASTAASRSCSRKPSSRRARRSS